MTLGTFTIVKNEAGWIGFHILSVLPHVQQMVFYDGNSTDGTIKIIEHIKRTHPLGARILLRKNKDIRNFKRHYQQVSNACLRELKTDYAWFCHPDMILLQGPGALFGKGEPLSMFVSMESIAGEPGGEMLINRTGRTDRWKSIMRNDFGLHYFGDYGSPDEDMYHAAVTGKAHRLYRTLEEYPYPIPDSGIKLLHFSDVRPYERRLGRMLSCLKNQGWAMCKTTEENAKLHPRVSLQSTHGFKYESFKDIPQVFEEHAAEFAAIAGKSVKDFCPVPLKGVSHAA